VVRLSFQSTGGGGLAAARKIRRIAPSHPGTIRRNMLTPDHLAISAETLEAGSRHVEAALGIRPLPGGKHPHMGTHNLLLGLGPGFYLEVIAIDPEAARPPHPRWFRLDSFSGPPRLTNWVARTDDLDAERSRLPVGAGTPRELSRGDFRWRIAIPETGDLPYYDCFPSVIEWQGGLHPSDRLPDSGCRLIGLTLSHPDARALAASLAIPDPRISVVRGAPGLTARIMTPAGERTLA
jgi:Glyoxalase-like domain